MADLTDPPIVRVAWLTGTTDADAADRLLRSELAGDVEVHRLCPQCGSSEHGRPLVVRRDGGPAPFVSLSRAEGVVMVAVSDAGPVGVDIEAIDAARFSGFTDVALHPGEVVPTGEQRAIVWTRKESLLKATGDGLHVDPTSVRVSEADRPARLLEWPGRGQLPSAQLHDLEIPGYAACVTVLTDREVEVRTRRAAPAGPPG